VLFFSLCIIKCIENVTEANAVIIDLFIDLKGLRPILSEV